MKLLRTYGSLCAALGASVSLLAGPTAVAQDQQVRWDMQSWFPSALPQAGTLGKEIERKINEVSGGQFQIRFYEPGALTPPAECFDAVSGGALQTCWTISAYWHGRNPAFSIFSAVPFGPEWPELLAWYFEGGGKQLHQALYEPHNIRVISCGGMSPEGAGWFRQEINSTQDFEGLKMRILGLGGATLDEVGASTQLLAAGDIYPALELGTIDAAEFATPAADRQLGFYEIAEHYYGPGWHQPATLYQLIVNLDAWNNLSDAQRAQLESVCGDNLRQAVAEGEGRQAGPLAYFEEQGVQIHRFPDEVLDDLYQAWLRVADRYSQQSPEFAEAWQSLQDFRADYHGRWRQWQHMPYRPAE
jgi:TRAP-type mannitol/chloroaromatic compound transport system substrate-binding protein